MENIFTQKKSDEVNDVQEDSCLKALLEKQLVNMQENPGKNVVANILNYSKVLEVKKSKNIDCIEIILN